MPARAGDDRKADYVRNAAKTVPVFMINGYIKGDHVYCAFSDDYGATYDVASQMIEAGEEDGFCFCVIPILTVRIRSWRDMRRP